MKAKETLEAFFKKLKEDNVKYSDIIPLLTKTQQDESIYVGRVPVHSHINGLHELTNACKKVTTREKRGNNECVQDFVVSFHGEVKVKFTCRLVKESDVRKPSKDGEWGINLTSFKLQKP